MRLLILSFLPLFMPSFSLALDGGSVGNGGDPVALEFKTAALRAIQDLRKGRIELPVSYPSLRRTAESVHVIIVESVLAVPFGDATQFSAAENFVQENLIRVNRAAWMQISDQRLKEALALHEILSLLGVEKTGAYPFSQKYAANSPDSLAGVASAASTADQSPCLPAVQNAGLLFRLINDSASSEVSLRDFLRLHAVATDALDEHCETPAMTALAIKRFDLFQVLLEETRPELNRIQNPRLPRNRQRSLYAYALHYGSWDIIQKLRKMGGSLKEMIAGKAFAEGTSDLMLAAGMNTIDVVEQLLIEGESPLRAADNGQTPLMQAAAGNGPEMIEFLLRAGADARVADQLGWTALTFAARYNSKRPTEILRLLLQAGADINAVTKEDYTPIYHSLRNTPEMTRALLEAGADVRETHRDGYSFLPYAFRDLSPDLVRLVIQSGGANHLYTPHGDPILCVYIDANPESIKALLDAGADPNGALATKPYTGIPCLELATNYGDVESVRLLLAAGAKVNAEDPAGFTALQVALFTDKTSALRVRLLLNAGADPNHAEKRARQTPLFLVKDKVNAAALVIAGADVNHADVNGNTPLIYAAANGPEDLILYLVQEAGADQTHQNRDGASAYDVALAKKRPQSILNVLRTGLSVPRRPPERRRRPSPKKRRPASAPSRRQGHGDFPRIGPRQPPGDNDIPPGGVCNGSDCRCSSGAIVSGGGTCG